MRWVGQGLCKEGGMTPKQGSFDGKGGGEGDLLEVQSPELMLTLRHIVEPFGVSNEPHPLAPVITKNQTYQSMLKLYSDVLNSPTLKK